MGAVIATDSQVRALKALADHPGSYIQYRFDLGGMLLIEPGGKIGCVPGARTIDACLNRGWLIYNVHKWGDAVGHIERRYTLTPLGKRVVREFAAKRYGVEYDFTREVER